MKTVKKGLSRGLSILLTLLMVLSLMVVGMVSSSAAQVDIADSGWYSGNSFYVEANINGTIAAEQMEFVTDGGANDTGYFTKTLTQTFTTEEKYFDFRVRLINSPYLVPDVQNQSIYEVKPAEDTEASLWSVKKEDGQHGDRFFRLNCSSFSSDTIDITINVKISGGSLKDLTYKVKSSGGSGGETTTTRTFNEGEYIYIKNFSLGNDNWILSDTVAWAHLYNSVSNDYCDTKFELCEGTGTAGEVGTYYRAKVTAGTYDKIVFTRNHSNSTGPFDGDWHNKTGNMIIDPTNNCYTGFSIEGVTYTSEMYTPTGGETGDITISDGKNTHIIIDRGNCGDYTNVNPYIYAWKTGTTNELTGAWRGTLSTKQDGLFFVGFDDPGVNFSFIASDSDDSPKTGDINVTYQGAGDYYYKLSDDGKGATFVKFVAYSGGSSGGGETASMWVDVVADKDYADTNIDRIYPTKTGSDYVFYLPSSVDITQLKIQHNYDESLKIGNNTIDGTAYSYNVDTNYNYTLGDASTGNVKFYKSEGVAALYTYTEESMPTTTKVKDYTKSDYNTTGTIMKIGADGAIDVDETNLKSIKGRGNSSWQASAEYLGKYAYNISLESKDISLIEGAKANKKYSLLANNMDESRMRNMIIYNLATEVGVKYTSKFETFDVYNNGLYMGSYLLAEKVEVGDPLVNIVDLEKINKKANTAIYENDSQNKATTSDTMYASNLVEPAESSYQDSGFLLEFEYSDRYSDEFSGFISTQGQHIVCKSPEYATKKEIEFIRDKWNAAEAKMYNTNATYKELDDVIDVESFARMYLIQELSKNLDAGCTSYYVYYDGGKFHAGVAWDYDWTLGQYGTSGKAGNYPTISSTRFSEVNSELSYTYGWHVNSKRMDKTDTKKFNAQAQLCQNENFWAVVAAEWNENFYSKALSYTEGSKIDSVSNFTTSKIAEYYNTINASVNMDEVRWGIIEKDTLKDKNWGSKDTGDTHAAASVYLHNWYLERLQWMNNGIDGHPNSQALSKTSYTIQPPKVTTDKQSYIAGEDVTLTITDITGGNYTYTIYKDGKELATDVTGNTYVDRAVTGTTAKYEVVAHTTKENSDKSSEKSAPAEITITGSSFAITNIEYPGSAEVGMDVVITVSTNTTEPVTYTLYDTDGTTVKDTNETGIFTVNVGDTADVTLTYKVKAQLDGDATKSAEKTVDIKVTAVSETYKVVLYFKSSDSLGYIPQLTTTGATENTDGAVMIRDEFICKNVSKTASYSWYTSGELEVSKAKDRLIVNIVSSRYAMEGELTLTPSSYSPNADGVIEIYLACDNLNYNAGGEIRDLTSWPEEKRNWTQSAANMIYDEKEVSEATYAAVASMIAPRYIGDVNNDGVVNVKDATLLQKSIAGTATLDADSRYISDVFYDGTISVKDATAIQKRVVNL